MLHRFRYCQGLSVFITAAFIIAISFAGSILLGRLFIKYLSQNQVGDNAAKEVNTNFKSKDNPAGQIVRLEQVPLSFIQAGVFADWNGALKSVDELNKAGFAAYAVRVAPYKVFTGVYRKKETALEAKKEMDAANISSYISSYVLNEKEIKFASAREIKDPATFLKNFNTWLMSGITLYEAPKFSSVKQEEVQAVIAEANKMYRAGLSGLKLDWTWYKALGNYQKALAELEKDWQEAKYRAAKASFLEVISEYIVWIQQNANK